MAPPTSLRPATVARRCGPQGPALDHAGVLPTRSATACPDSPQVACA